MKREKTLSEKRLDLYRKFITGKPKKQKETIELIFDIIEEQDLDEIEKHIDNKEELKLAYKMHKDMGEYGRGYMDCYEQTNDVFKELKDKIKQKAGDKLLDEVLK